MEEPEGVDGGDWLWRWQESIMYNDPEGFFFDYPRAKEQNVKGTMADEPGDQ